MTTSGENYVKLVGYIKYRELASYNDYSNFKCKLAIPINESFQYIKVAAWGDLAESLAELPEGTCVKIHGHIEETSYSSKCKYCSGPLKVYWTNVVVDNYIIIEEI